MGTSGTWTGYVDGKPDITAVGSALSANATAASYISGRSYVGSLNPFPGWISDMRVYNRAITASEVKWLCTEPYANVTQPVYRRYFVAAGSSFQPAWAAHASHVIGVSNA
jgi:hypothetical protein